MKKEKKTIERVIEMDLKTDVEHEIAILLDECFPDTFDGRSYYKQLPHARLLLRENNLLIGHLGIDYRVIRNKNKISKVIGIIDLCVKPSFRGTGCGTSLLKHAENIAINSQATHILLFADRSDLYLRSGYTTIDSMTIKWMAIEDVNTHSIQSRDFKNTFMIKTISADHDLIGHIDLLGYLF